jgi:lipopolysaccharide export system protein LptA
MPRSINRLRRWLVGSAVLLTSVVAGMYFLARSRQRNVLNEVPGKIGYGVKQTASGFQFSKSERGRTLFTVQARDVKQFELNGRAELHQVNIILYGRDASRFDQISGNDFLYDPKSGDITAKGEVRIDLEANPAGATSPDQAAPRELKNAIHLKTTDLVFNKETGNAFTNARVDFRGVQASGSAVGIQYAGHSNTLTLSSQVHLLLTGASPSVVDAVHAVVTGQPRQILFDRPVLHRGDVSALSDQATLFLGPDNSVERLIATGNVHGTMHVAPKQHTKQKNAAGLGSTGESGAKLDKSVEQDQSSEMHARSDQAELLFTSAHNELRTAILTGNVQVDRIGLQNMEGNAGRVILDYSGKNELQKVHAAERVRLAQHAGTNPKTSANGGTGAHDFELTSPIIDFYVVDGRFLDHADTSGDAKITILPAHDSGAVSATGNPPADSADQRTVITAGKFKAKFVRTPEGGSGLSTMHGAPDAKIVNSSADQPDRISTSRTLDATFVPRGGIESIVQQGNVAYTDNQSAEKRTQAWADHARYTPADQLTVLTGTPRVIQGGTATTARMIYINHATGQARAEDNVKTTYSDLSEQPSGALLASSSPIHVTARSMIAYNTTGLALYTGDARLWQDANIIEAPSILFDREHRSVTAEGTVTQPVSTLLIQASNSASEKNPREPQKTPPNPQKSEKYSPVAVTAAKLRYTDAERKAHYEDNVLAKGSGFTAAGKSMDVYLLPRSQTSKNQSLAGPGQLDRIVGQGDVIVQQPGRRAVGQQLVYTAAEDKFVLSGGGPSIFDAERGKTTGVSLTFFRRDDRVLVDGQASSPVVTQTRVAR